MRAIATLILWSTVLCLGAHAGPPPNVLLICVDDLKPLLGCYGDDVIQTPNIDRLAARGVRFERAYCNQAICSPSRNALLTGLRPQTLGIYDLATNFRVAAPDAVTLPQHFKAHGYRAEALGKVYHVGHGNHDDAASWSVPHRGARNVFWALAENRVVQRPADQPSAAQPSRGTAYEAADVADSAYPDGRTAREAVRRLRRAAQTPDVPFFLAVGFVKPHLPLTSPKKYWELYDPSAFTLAEWRAPPENAPDFAGTQWGELRRYSGIPQTGPLPDELQRTMIHAYYAAVSFIDAQIGRVLDTLDETGQAENTIIVVWGDHGWHLGDHGYWCKHTNYEQAARIPLLVVAPGDAARDAAAGGLVESVDIYPTLCELAGLEVPEGLDGVSFAAVMADPSAATRDAAMHVYPRRNMIGRAVRTARYRLVEWKRPGASPDTAVLELYDYELDPDETTNLASEQPKAVAELRALLAAEPEAKPQLHVEAASRNTEPATVRTVAAQVSAPHQVPRPENIVARDEWGSDADPIPDSRKHTPRWITIHHAGVLWTGAVEPAQFVRNMQSWGKRRPELEQPPRDTYWPDLPYHFLIAPDGRIFEGRPVEYEPESNTEYDLAGNLGVEMMGNFEQQRPSPEQLGSVVRLTAWLMQQHDIDIDRVRTHRDAAPGQTTCPGRDFYRYITSGQFAEWIETVLRGEDLAIAPGPPLTDPPGPTELITDTRPPTE